MPNSTLEQLFAEALVEVESGVKHPCKTTEHCCEMGGCPRCFQGVMRGDIGILGVDVFADSSIVRVTTVGHDGKPCVVSFRKVPLTIAKHNGGNHGQYDDRRSAGSRNRTDAGRVAGVQRSDGSLRRGTEFHDEYLDRLRLNAEYEAKFARL